MDFLMIFSDFEAILGKHSGLRGQKSTLKSRKKGGKATFGLSVKRP